MVALTRMVGMGDNVDKSGEGTEAWQVEGSLGRVVLQGRASDTPHSEFLGDFCFSHPWLDTLPHCIVYTLHVSSEVKEGLSACLSCRQGVHCRVNCDNSLRHRAAPHSHFTEGLT